MIISSIIEFREPSTEIKDSDSPIFEFCGIRNFLVLSLSAIPVLILRGLVPE